MFWDFRGKKQAKDAINAPSPTRNPGPVTVQTNSESGEALMDESEIPTRYCNINGPWFHPQI